MARPREFDGPPVSVRLPARLHDDICREALRRDIDKADVIRERLSRVSVSQNLRPSEVHPQ
jgi:hypothetical protein